MAGVLAVDALQQIPILWPKGIHCTERATDQFNERVTIRAVRVVGHVEYGELGGGGAPPEALEGGAKGGRPHATADGVSEGGDANTRQY